jgi:hypothetical protein
MESLAFEKGDDDDFDDDGHGSGGGGGCSGVDYGDRVAKNVFSLTSVTESGNVLRFFFRRVRRTAKSDYSLRYVCLSWNKFDSQWTDYYEI